MVDFEQYPHTITSSTPSAQVEPFQDANGDWIIPGPGLVDTITSECRAKPNDQGKTVSGIDGIALDFQYLVYLPLTTPDFITGSPVVIPGVGNGTVKRFFRGQLNCMLWA